MSPLTRLSLLGELTTIPAKESAWDEFAAAYGSLIRDWATRTGLQHADADDITQLVLLKLVGGLASYDPSRGRFRSWLKKLVRNAITDFVLLNERRRQTLAIVDDGRLDALRRMPPEDGAESLVNSLFSVPAIDPILTRSVTVARGRMTGITWAMFEAVAVNDQPPVEVATTFGVSVAAVYQSVRRARKTLAEEYRILADPQEPEK